MNIYKNRMMGIFLLMLLVAFFPQSTRAEVKPSSLYKQVLQTLERLPREKATIAIDIGVEEQRYQEQFKVTNSTLHILREKGLPTSVVDALAPLVNQSFSTKEEFITAAEKTIGNEHVLTYQVPLLNAVYEGFAVFDFEENVEIRFRADTTCYVALMHIAEGTENTSTGTYSGGEITFLVPNKTYPEVQINADEVYSTLYHFDIDITAIPPVADELVNIICSTEPLDFFAPTALQGDYYVIAPDNDIALQKLLDGLQALEQTRWGGSSLVLRIGGGIRALPRKFGAIPPMGGLGTTGKSGKFFPPIGATGSTGKQ
jgi:hypothetical protein